MVQTLRSMQAQGYLDSWSGELLDRVDRVVFDAQADRLVRQEALGFLMDHTEGFEAFNQASVLPAIKSKKGDTKALLVQAQHRNTSLQLETLTEFAEYHLGEHVEHPQGVDLLAEACLAIEDKACKSSNCRS
jgi:hypothetical protein